MCLARQIVHMDLKSPNVLLRDRSYLIAKIADLGLSRQIAEGSLMTNCGHGARLPERGLCASAACMASLVAGRGHMVWQFSTGWEQRTRNCRWTRS